MEETHTYEMMANPSYSISGSRKTVKEYSTRENGSAQNQNSKKETGPGFKVNLCTVAALIAACIAVVLAVGSIVIALVAYINTNGEDGQSVIVDMQAQITQLSQDLNVTQSQLSELQIGINQTVVRREDLIAGTYSK
jgi:hypothetical protein